MLVAFKRVLCVYFTCKCEIGLFIRFCVHISEVLTKSSSTVFVRRSLPVTPCRHFFQISTWLLRSFNYHIANILLFNFKKFLVRKTYIAAMYTNLSNLWRFSFTFFYIKASFHSVKTLQTEPVIFCSPEPGVHQRFPPLVNQVAVKLPIKCSIFPQISFQTWTK